MTGLLVSVRNVREAEDVLPHVDVLDVKEPSRGPLGAADSDVIAAVASRAQGRVPVSAALGELLELPEGLPERLPPVLSLAKLGLAGCGACRNWPERWQAALRRLPGVTPVAVAYADWCHCGAPTPQDVLHHGLRLGCAAVLLDTFDKSAGGLLDHMPARLVQQFLASARDARLITVVAGSLTVKTISEVLPWQPDYVAVRGAACSGSRSGAIDPHRVANLAAQVHQGATSARPG